jgi:GNAT superfamily N-acetyltransferase
MDSLQFRVPEIRRASLADAVVLDELLPLATRYVLHGFRGPLPAPLPMGHLASVDRMLLMDGTALLVEAGPAPLAFGAWSRRDRDPGSALPDGSARRLDPGSEPARVLSLFVRSDFTGKGLAGAVLEACAAEVRADGFRTISMLAFPEAVAMGIRSGFSQVRPLTVEVGGEPREVVEMTQQLRR